MNSCVVVGPGAIGLLFACRLSRVLTDVAILDYRADRADRLTRSGIRLTEDGAELAYSIPVYADPGLIPFRPHFVLFVT
ncbi:MAG: 2-dehydropantoate 2-reductase N-terminal domain-containing protein, partial [Candidatus Poribacteria bacterium]